MRLRRPADPCSSAGCTRLPWLAATALLVALPGPVLGQAQAASSDAHAARIEAAAPASGAPRTETLTVVEPFIDVHTGPGRGYPVFFSVPRGESVVVTLRRTDWYRVLTPQGREGWVHRRQLQDTLTEAGARRSFRDLLLDDYLGRRVELGAAVGRFERDPLLKAWSAYRLSDTLRVEGTLGQVQGAFSGSSYWHVDLSAEPWSDRRLSPSVAVGFGSFRNVPNASLVGIVDTDARLATATLGLRYHLAERFVLRADYTLHTAFVGDTRSVEFRSISAGLSFFF